MPDLSKDSGMNMSEKSNMGTLNSSLQLQSSESLQSLTSVQPFPSVALPVRLQYPPQYYKSPQSFPFGDDGHASGYGAQRTPSSRRRARTPEAPPPRRRHRRHTRRSRLSCSDNALHLVSERQTPAHGPLPPQHLRDDYGHFPQAPPNRGLFGANWYRPEPCRPCPRTTSDLNLQNPIDRYPGQHFDGCGDGEEWCSTCSSSSQSDDEGYFLGEPIPRAVGLRYMTGEELRHHQYGSPGLGARGQLHTRKHRKTKNCIIS